MPIAAILEFRFKPDVLDQVPDVLRRVLAVTRTFDGCQRLDVLVDDADKARWVVVELWESREHDAAYRAFRAGQGRATELAPLLAGPPDLTYYSLAGV